MNSAHAKILRELLKTHQVAALGTLHKGRPYVSMVPFALLPGGTGFVIHVSTLASHTKDMLASPEVSLLVVAPVAVGVSPQELARVTIQGQAVPVAALSPGHLNAKSVYLARFPQSAQMFSFSDFSLFAIVPTLIRFVGGFAQARTISAETLTELMRES
jgi:putative heme iron utilization protein